MQKEDMLSVKNSKNREMYKIKSERKEGRKRKEREEGRKGEKEAGREKER